MSDEWHKTACILCSVNCGIEVQLDGRTHRARPRRHGASRARRATPARRRSASTTTRTAATASTSPLRRRADGTLRGDRLGHRDPRDRRARSVRVRDAHGGATIFYYGGGGQGNHLGGAYARATRARSARSTPRTRWRRRRPASSGSTASSSAGRAATPPATSSTPRSRCSSARTRGSRTASRAPAPCCARSPTDPDARADRHRSAPHRDRRARRLSTSRCAPAPTPSASRALLGGAGAGGSRRPRLPRATHAGERRGALRARCAPCRSPTTARAPASPRTLVRDGRAAHRRRRERRRSSRTSASSRRRTARSTRTSRSCVYLLTGNFAQARRR